MRTLHLLSGNAFSDREHRILHMVARTPENTPVTQDVTKQMQEQLAKNITALTTSPEAARTAAQARVKAVTDQQNKTQKEFSETAQKEATALFEALTGLAAPNAMTPQQRVDAITAVFGNQATVTGVGTAPDFTGVTVQMRYPEYTRNPQTEMAFFLARLPDDQRKALQDNADFKAFQAAMPGLERPLQLAIIDILPAVQDPVTSIAAVRAVAGLNAADRTILFREAARTPNPFEQPTRPNTIPQNIWDVGSPAANRAIVVQLGTNLGTVRAEEQTAEQRKKNAVEAKEVIDAARLLLGSADTYATMTPDQQNTLRGRVMMQKGVSVTFVAGPPARFDVTYPTDTMAKLMNRLEGALLWFGSMKKTANDAIARGNGTLSGGPASQEPMPESPTAIDRSRVNGINYLNGQTTAPAVSRQGTTNNFTTAAVALGITGQATSAVSYAFNNNRWEVTIPGLGARPAAELATPAAFEMAMKANPIMSVPEPQRAAVTASRNVLAARITALAAFDAVTVQENTVKEGAEKVRADARASIATIDGLVTAYTRDCSTGEGGRPLANSVQVNTKKAELTDLLGPAATPRVLTAPQLAQAQALVKDLNDLAEGVRTEYKDVKIEKNVHVRLARGKDALLPANRNATFGQGQLSEGDVRDRGGNVWLIDITGWGTDFHIKWNPTERRFQTKTDNSVWYNTTDGDYVDSISNTTGRAQANACVHTLLAIETATPITRAGITVPPN